MIAHDKKFSKIAVYLDGATFVGCTFENCKLIYSGTLPLHLTGCKFNECSWEFAGPAAATIGFMTALHKMGGGAKDLIEATFVNIRNGDGTGRRGNDPIVLN